MAPLFAEFAPIARFLVRNAAGIRPELGLGFVPKSRLTILVRILVYGALCRRIRAYRPFSSAYRRRDST